LIKSLFKAMKKKHTTASYYKKTKTLMIQINITQLQDKKYHITLISKKP